jgi:hypothetical protein
LIEGKQNNISTFSTSNTCNSLTAKPIKLKFEEKLLHVLNQNWFNFEANPTVDLRETINQPKSPEASPWKSFHETLFNTLYFQHLQLPHNKTDQAEI